MKKIFAILLVCGISIIISCASTSENYNDDSYSDYDDQTYSDDYYGEPTLGESVAIIVSLYQEDCISEAYYSVGEEDSYVVSETYDLFISGLAGCGEYEGCIEDELGGLTVMMMVYCPVTLEEMQYDVSQL